MKEVRDARIPVREFKTDVVVLFGPTGCGKTRAVMDRYGARNVYIKDASQWWDGYDVQPVVLLDEFYGQLPYAEMPADGSVSASCASQGWLSTIQFKINRDHIEQIPVGLVSYGS